MSFFPGNDPVAGDAFACDAIENRIRISGFPPSPICSTAKSSIATVSAPNSSSAPATST